MVALISYGDLMMIYRRLREMGAEAVFALRGTPYKLAIDRFIHARDPDGRRVPWSQAFGPQRPHDVLNTYGVQAVVVKIGDRELRFESLGEFLRWIRPK